jgi:hypothetical protein
MKREIAMTFSATVMSVALLLPGSVLAQNNQSDPAAQTAQDQAGQALAQQMVGARVALKEDLNAAKVKPGDQVRTTLAHKILLKNGTELPAGTVILGVISTDDMQQSGTSKLALNFDRAQLKDGTIVPIKATMLGVYPPESEDASGRPVAPGDQETGDWANHPLAVNQVDALPGVDLHSRIAGTNSGVLVSSKRDVKLHWGSEISLAIAPQAAVTAGE